MVVGFSTVLRRKRLFGRESTIEQYDLPERSSSPRLPASHRAAGETELGGASDTDRHEVKTSCSSNRLDLLAGAGAVSAASSTVERAAPRPIPWRSSRDRWLLSIGRWLLASGFEAPGLTGEAAAQAVGAAFYAILVKGIEGAPEWSGAQRGSRPWEWGQTHSTAKHSLLDNPA